MVARLRKPDSNHLEPNRLKNIFAYIENYIKPKNIDLKDAVKYCFMSQGHLSRAFMNSYQVSVMDYIHMKKISLAKAYFLLTEHSAPDIGDMIGYNERSYFGRVFKKYEKSTVQQ
jgi:two-component system response regulator YesN